MREGYEELWAMLLEAFHQASEGKGKERHANDLPFMQQPVMQISRMVGPGFAAGQAMKKLQEAIGMFQRGSNTAAERELLGAIVYTAATVLAIREGK